MPLAKRALDLPARSSSNYPEPFRSRVLPREKRALGDAFGLTAFGVNLTILSPGKESSMRHHHSREDELLYLLEGELVLRTDHGEEQMSAGMVVAFPAGSKNAHQFVNRGTVPAVYLEVGNRHRDDEVEYPDDDLALTRAPDGGFVFSKKSGG